MKVDIKGERRQRKDSCCEPSAYVKQGGAVGLDAVVIVQGEAGGLRSFGIDLRVRMRLAGRSIEPSCSPCDVYFFVRWLMQIQAILKF